MNFYHYSYYTSDFCGKNGPRKRKKVHMIIRADDAVSAQNKAEMHIKKILGASAEYSELTLTNVKSISLPSCDDGDIRE